MELLRKTIRLKIKVILIFLFVFGSCLYPNTCHSTLLKDCPLIEIKGRLLYYVFPGPPNYESIEEGDTPESRWVLEIDKDTYLRVVELIPKMHEWYQPFDVPEDDERYFNGDWVQLAESKQIEEKFKELQNKEVVLKGFIGGWPTGHVHTRFILEIDSILEPKR